MKFSREEYIAHMNFEDIGKEFFCELFGPLVGLPEEWRKQGASDAEIELTAFDWDYVETVGCGAETGILGGYKPRVIEDNDNYRIETDTLGRRTKLIKSSATIPLPLDYPVRDMDDWLRIKSMFQYDDRRINREAVGHAIRRQQQGALVMAGIPGGFDLPRNLMGEEELCVAYYEQPELVRDILETMGGMACRTLDIVSDLVTIDCLFVHEDMAGKSGPLPGPNMVEAFLKRYYLPIMQMLKAKGTSIFSQDSDGDMNSVISGFLECGINSMHPAEPAAGMDIVAIRKKYGKKLSLKGGLDKHVLRGTKEDIRRELEYKMQPLMRRGGTVFALDHRIPNGTPLENYRYYVNTGREILGKEPVKNDTDRFYRMAF